MFLLLSCPFHCASVGTTITPSVSVSMLVQVELVASPLTHVAVPCRASIDPMRSIIPEFGDCRSTVPRNGDGRIFSEHDNINNRGHWLERAIGVLARAFLRIQVLNFLKGDYCVVFGSFRVQGFGLHFDSICIRGLCAGWSATSTNQPTQVFEFVKLILRPRKVAIRFGRSRNFGVVKFNLGRVIWTVMKTRR